MLHELICASRLCLSPFRPGLRCARATQGSVTNQDDVDRVFADNDITGAVVCLGGKTKKVGKTMLTDGTAAVVNSCKRFGVKRIAVVTSLGCGDSQRKAPFFFKVLIKTMMRSIFADKNNQGTWVHSSSHSAHQKVSLACLPTGR